MSIPTSIEELQDWVNELRSECQRLDYELEQKWAEFVMAENELSAAFRKEMDDERSLV